MPEKVGLSVRDLAITRVMRAVARRSVVLGPLPVKAHDGSYPVIVTLPDDTLGFMEDSRNDIGRNANVFVAFPERIVLIAMRDGQSDDAAPVDPRASMAMFVSWLENTDMKRPAIRVERAGAESARPRVEELAYVF